jgi:hypothetical protein
MGPGLFGAPAFIMLCPVPIPPRVSGVGRCAIPDGIRWQEERNER